MRPIPDGYTTSFELVVREHMTVDFEQPEPEFGKLHPVYATYWLTKHMELVSRKIILPFLDAHEAGIGHEVSVRHLGSALPGMRVELTAQHRETVGNRVYAVCEAHNELGDKIGEGGTTQVILPEEKLLSSFERLRQTWEGRRNGLL